MAQCKKLSETETNNDSEHTCIWGGVLLVICTWIAIFTIIGLIIWGSIAIHRYNYEYIGLEDNPVIRFVNINTPQSFCYCTDDFDYNPRIIIMDKNGTIIVYDDTITIVKHVYNVEVLNPSTIRCTENRVYISTFNSNNIRTYDIDHPSRHYDIDVTIYDYFDTNKINDHPGIKSFSVDDDDMDNSYITFENVHQNSVYKLVKQEKYTHIDDIIDKLEYYPSTKSVLYSNLKQIIEYGHYTNKKRIIYDISNSHKNIIDFQIATNYLFVLFDDNTIKKYAIKLKHIHHQY